MCHCRLDVHTIEEVCSSENVSAIDASKLFLGGEGAIGQAMQNASTLLEKSSLIFGGTFDNSIEQMLDVDGINESLVNCVLVK